MITRSQILGIASFAILATSAWGANVDPRFFPSIDQYSDEAIRLHGLASLFPGRVLFDDPSLNTVNTSRAAARVEELPKGIRYIRLYRLSEAQSVLHEHREHAALIVDFRYLKSELAALPILNAFAQKQWSEGLTTIGATPEQLIEDSDESFAQRSTPIIVLCNRETAGPFEAVLDKLQREGAIIAVGQSTAGRTGFYQKTAEHAWLLNGEIKPDPAISLVGIGLKPRIQVEVDAKESYQSYHLYEAGTDLKRLLETDRQSKSESDDTVEKDNTLHQTDRILQRGVDIIAALQILQQQPDL